MEASPRSRRRGALALALLALALLPFGAIQSASAQSGLYGPEAPVDAAWVRVVNAGAGAGVAVRIADGGTRVLALFDATRYALVDPGPVRVDVGGDTVAIDVGPESFTTIAATPAGVVVVPDPALRDISRGLLGLVNLTDRAGLDLRVPGGPTVVAAVPPGAHDAVAVAEATVELAVVDGSSVVARLDARAFERGVAYAVVAVETSEGVVAFVLAATGD
ncbi:MAG: alginate O-acetyltransferase AlgF [Trueperaceae bacterium]